MDIVVLSLIAGAFVVVGLWLATRESPAEPESIITHVTPVGGNIFADLGFEPEEAAKLLAETDAIVPPPTKGA